MLKRALAPIPALLLLATLSACGDDETTSTATDDASASESTSATTSDGATETGGSDTGADATCAYAEDGSGDAELPPAEPAYDGDVKATATTSIGDFAITLDGAAAPCTVNSFASLVEQGFYDDTSCHRMTVTQGFQVLQCGDPTATGTGGPGYTIPDEFDGSETYPAGTLAMAKTSAPDSGGSQFFIVYGDTALPPAYTVFGTVDQATIDAIAEAAKAGVTPQMGPEDGAPVTPIDIETITLD